MNHADNDSVDGSSEMLSFHFRRQASRLGPRSGEIRAPDRPHISTPALVATTSRGVIPHVTPDLVQKHTAIAVTYAGLEDFIEKSRQNAPILNAPQTHAVSRLRAYTSLPDRCLSILGPRRVPRLGLPAQNNNTNSSFAISTSFGFASLEINDYNLAAQKLHPDVGISAVDLVDEDKISKKRAAKSADRTHAWLRDTLAENETLGARTPLFASIPPLEAEQQSLYMSDLVSQFAPLLTGVCVYEAQTMSVIPGGLDKLPILCLSSPQGPHELLRTIALGADLVTTPFVTDTSEAGIALTFTLIPTLGAQNVSLGVDMWATEHATDLSPLASNCTCYTCSRHHRAYLHHLLQAKEMLAWTLLQIHNFHVLDQFFKHIRDSIAKGTFEQDSQIFQTAYETVMPQKTGQGPRVRGYQVRSVGAGEPKKNERKFNRFEEQARKIEEAESGVATPEPDQDAEMLEAQGLGQKTDQV